MLGSVCVTKTGSRFCVKLRYIQTDLLSLSYVTLGKLNLLKMACKQIYIKYIKMI